MDQWFYSAATLKVLFAAIGYDLEISQLSPGALKGRFQLGGSRLVPVISITTNQSLVFEGDRRAGWLAGVLHQHQRRRTAGARQRGAATINARLLQ